MDTKNDDQLGLIFSRRSIRVYAPGDVSEAAVTKLLEAAMAAPSAMTKDPWRFVVVRDRERLARLTEALPGGKMLVTAAVAVIVCGDLEAAFEQNISYLLQDCSACIENLLLGAQALGLGACWVGIHPAEGMIRKVKEMFGLPASIVPVAAIALGVPGEQPEPRTRYQAQYVHLEKWAG